MMKYITGTGFFILITLIISGWYLSPIFKQFPKPTGSFAVGTCLIELRDTARSELYSENLNDCRTIVVRFFYPAQLDNHAEKYPYLGAKMPYYQQWFSMHFGMPTYITKFLLSDIATHTFINAPIATNQACYPIVLFSHGLLGFPSDGYISLLENLASHGYIIAAIDHPYLNGLTLYANGHRVTSDKLSDAFNNMSPQEQAVFQTNAIEVYKADISYTIQELAKLNDDTNHLLYHHLDLARIGIMGSSAGGTAAIEICRINKQCKAAINLDGWYDHIIGSNPINQPLLLLFGSESIKITEPTSAYLARKHLTKEQYYEREQKVTNHRQQLCNTSYCSMIIIPDATHADFGDEILLKWPFRPWNAAESYETLSIINKHIVQFFDTYFKGKR